MKLLHWEILIDVDGAVVWIYNDYIFIIIISDKSASFWDQALLRFIGIGMVSFYKDIVNSV